MDPSRSDDHAGRLGIRARAELDQLSAEWRDLVQSLLVHYGMGCRYPGVCIGPAALALEEMDAQQLRRLLWPALCQAVDVALQPPHHREGDPPC
jgi:hypothetical protein